MNITDTDLQTLEMMGGAVNSGRPDTTQPGRTLVSLRDAHIVWYNDFIRRAHMPDTPPVVTPPAPPPALWVGDRAPVVPYPGHHFDDQFNEMVCYSYSIIMPFPPYITASLGIRGSVAIQPDFRAPLVCKVSETPYDMGGYDGTPIPNGTWMDAIDWVDSLAGKTFYLNFVLGRGAGSRTVRVEAFYPTHGVRDANT